MDTCSLPLLSFVTLEKYGLKETPEMSDRSHFGNVLEVDLEYPTELLDLNENLPLAPTKEVVEIIWLSEFRAELRARMQFKTMIKTKPYSKRKTLRLIKSHSNLC